MATFQFSLPPEAGMPPSPETPSLSFSPHPEIPLCQPNSLAQEHHTASFNWHYWHKGAGWLSRTSAAAVGPTPAARVGPMSGFGWHSHCLLVWFHPFTGSDSLQAATNMLHSKFTTLRRRHKGFVWLRAASGLCCSYKWTQEESNTTALDKIDSHSFTFLRRMFMMRLSCSYRNNSGCLVYASFSHTGKCAVRGRQDGSLTFVLFHIGKSKKYGGQYN